MLGLGCNPLASSAPAGLATRNDPHSLPLEAELLVPLGAFVSLALASLSNARFEGLMTRGL